MDGGRSATELPGSDPGRRLMLDPTNRSLICANYPDHASKNWYPGKDEQRQTNVEIGRAAAVGL